MDLSLLFVIMFIFLLGIGSQWVAWRFSLPAIVIMSIAGLVIGPFFGWMNPEESFGELYDPLISVAVAIILFEGSLNLSFKELSGLGKPVFRIATIGALIAWILGSFTAHYIAGLSWEVAFVIGGLFIVTGPTVIMPLLRQSKLKPRPAKILKWEGIIVDPLGVLLAVFAFEIISFFTSGSNNVDTLLLFFFGSALAVLLGWFSGRSLGWMFETGHIPEFLKSPAVFVVVIFSFTLPDELVHGTGLLSVTAMGMTLANAGINSLNDFRHFKENVSLLLISAIFIMLASSLNLDTILHIFNPHIIGYVLLMMFVVRPLSIFISTIGTGLTTGEKSLVGWIAPRGIVALTVSSYFANILLEAGYEDARLLTTLTFGLVFFTVVAHGFTISPIAKRLNLSLEGKPGILIVGSNPFTVNLAQSFIKKEFPVLIVDSSWENLRYARNNGVPFYHGEILSEQTEYNLDTIPYDYIIAATNYDSYNALVCTTFMPEYGRTNVFKVDPSKEENNNGNIVSRVGGRSLCKDEVSLDELVDKVKAGYLFRHTKLTEVFNYKAFEKEKEEEAVFLYFIKPSTRVYFYADDMRMTPAPGDVIVSLTTPQKEVKKIKKKLESNGSS
ncbi:MAG TPA: sodium:proton antiporter [Pseudogracilibacillus sp.]|nr:sodium:proton antiporter [Pseudogracilibacillus sp.]